MNSTTEKDLMDVSLPCSFSTVYPYVWRLRFQEVYMALGVVFTILALLIVLKNGITLVTFKRIRSLQTRMNALLCCLSTLELLKGLNLFVSVVKVFALAENNVLCLANDYIRQSSIFFYSSSLFLLLVICSERYLAIFYPFRHHIWFTRRTIILIILLLSVIEIILTALQYFYMFSLGTAFVSTMCIIQIGIHTRLYWRSRQQRKQIISQHLAVGASTRHLRERKAIKTCLVLLANIFVPYALVFVFYKFSLTLESNIGFLMSSILGIIHNASGCLTPCILFCTNKSFGVGIRKTLSDLRSFLQHNLTLKTTNRVAALP